MKSVHLTLLGLGPGDPNLLTRQAWQILENATEIYLRTSSHPIVQSLPKQLKIHTFDSLYESAESFDAVYQNIIEQVLLLARRAQGVIYAVPGHPFVAEATCPEIYRRACEQGLTVEIVEGLSFIEPTLTALGIDPLPNLYLVDGHELSASHNPSFPPTAPALIAQIHSREIASDVKLNLLSIYPDEHPVKLIHAAGTNQQMVENLMLYEIDRSQNIGLLTSLYVPTLGRETSFESFQEIIARLRAPDGCPWDREQTHLSLRQYLLEETYEVLEAIDADDPLAMQEELGDLLLQIVLHAQIASESGEFNMVNILRHINMKIVNRHPHVFGDLDLADAHEVLTNWEKLKATERQTNGKNQLSLLDSVAQVLPSLLQAQSYQQRAANVGFDWPDIQGVQDKLDEELREVHAACTQQELSAEIGDLLFAVVNLARWNKVEAESALREANRRFRQRFNHIEQVAQAQGKTISDLTLEEMESLWQAAKEL